jgi:hypothetical protein
MGFGVPLDRRSSRFQTSDRPGGRGQCLRAIGFALPHLHDRAQSILTALISDEVLFHIERDDADLPIGP